jgi:hypothetical protein
VVPDEVGRLPTKTIFEKYALFVFNRDIGQNICLNFSGIDVMIRIFGEKFGVFLRNQCHDHIFAKTSSM